MQFQKHNFAHNFLNAAATDKPVAWDILVNEINEIILDMPAGVKDALTSSGIKVAANANASDLLSSVHDGFYVNDQLRNKILKLIAKRHTNPQYNADGGLYDQVVGIEPTDFNMDGANIAEDENTLNFVWGAAKDLVVTAKDKVQGAIEKNKTKEKAEKSLAQKQKQRNMPVSRPKGSMPPMKIIGIVLAAAAVIGTAAYLIYRSNKKQA